jgi:hypothetical protein
MYDFILSEYLGIEGEETINPLTLGQAKRIDI